MNSIGDFLIPITVFIIVAFGLIKKVSVFDSFTAGVKQGISSTIAVAPALVALVSAVNMLKQSGLLDLLCSFISPLTDKLGIPSEVMPLALMRPVSGSGSTAILNSILHQYGADSLSGKIASVMAGSTETTFYAIAVYYGAANIKNTRYTVPSAIAADLTGMTVSCILIRLFG